MVLPKARQPNFGPALVPGLVHPETDHWFTAWDRKHEAEQARTKARNLEFIFLDMASQAVTMDHYDKREAKYAQQGYL